LVPWPLKKTASETWHKMTSVRDDASQKKSRVDLHTIVNNKKETGVINERPRDDTKQENTYFANT